MANQANMNLDSAVRKYVQIYIALKREAGRNLMSVNTAIINKQFADAMRIYVGKRLAVAVATTAAVTQAGGNQRTAFQAGAAAGAAAGAGNPLAPAAAAAEQIPAAPLNQRRAAAQAAAVTNAAAYGGATNPQAANAGVRSAASPNFTGQGLPPNARAAAINASKRIQNIYVNVPLRNGTKRRINKRTGKFVNGQTTVPPYYVPKKGFFGGWRANINNAAFKKWALTGNLNSLPKNIQNKYKNYLNTVKRARSGGQVIPQAGILEPPPPPRREMRPAPPPPPSLPKETWKILGLNKNTATLANVRKSYLEKSLRGNYRHPNKGGNSELFAKLGAAKSNANAYIQGRAQPLAPSQLKKVLALPSPSGPTRGSALFKQAKTEPNYKKLFNRFAKN
jgi:hypothetical protein